MKRWIQLVRAPAALTVLGDTAAGAAAAGIPLRGRRCALPLASVALYWSGMVLNDWADRSVDAVERPERPVPSGRISPRQALLTAAALSTAGLGLAALGGGRRALRVAVPLVGAIWAYDTTLKSTVTGPVAMSACRGLDVLLGGSLARDRSALVPAATMFVHTLGVTTLSRAEVHGGSRRHAVLAGTTTVTAAAMANRGRTGSAAPVLCAAAGTFGYAAAVGRAQLAAGRDPSAENMRRATAAGIHGMIPLQAALIARGGFPLPAGFLATALPVARRLARNVSPT